MTTETPRAPDMLRQLTAPIAVAVAIAVALAWVVTWSSMDLVAQLMMPERTATNPAALVVFLILLTVMMVAMMLPSALPMILVYRGFTRLEGGRPVKRADAVGTALFVLPYFLLWGGFSVLALFGLMALGLMGTLRGPLLLIPAAVLAAAGVYQFTRPKEVCLAQCQSPMGFVTRHWRTGRAGAMKIGARHAMYCIGCCWLFMIVLFVVGAMSLVWMGIVSVFIFTEKVGFRRFPASRAIGGVLLGFAAVVATSVILTG